MLGAIAFAVWRYRGRGEGGADLPPAQSRRLRLLEGGWIGAVAITVIALLVITFRSQDDINALGDERPAATVDVTAFQWGWRFHYPSADVTQLGTEQRPPTLVVPTGVPVRFRLISRDVIHSFWIPDLRFKRDAFPERETEFDLVFDPDTGIGRCAEFCGLGHARMDFHVLPLSPSAFDRWLARRTSEGRRAR